MFRASFNTAIGRCSISWDERGLTGFELPIAAILPTDQVSPPPKIGELIGRAQRHLAGDLQDFSDLPFVFATVSEFHAKVYQATLKIKSGRTSTYGEIAVAIGYAPAVSRAVGSALGANPWPLLIPCHRVVAADGHMTGFSSPGGIKTKLTLLALEGAQLFAV